jgi:glycosyltransferase involved in cell wall biosynthesis
MSLISVIIPVYNVKKYLPACIESVLQQDMHDMEIFLVDDGSTDGGGEICDIYAQRDRRITIIHQANGGLSRARNVAIDRATAPYLFFVDSDDTIHPHAISTLFQLCEKNNSQIATADYYRVSEKVTRINHLTSNECNNLASKIRTLSAVDATTELLYGGAIEISAWGKLYRSDLFEGIRFPEGKIHEDAATVWKLFLNAKSITTTSQRLYYYTIRTDSITGSGFKPESMQALDFTREIIEYAGGKEPLHDAAVSRHVTVVLSRLIGIARSEYARSEYERVLRGELARYYPSFRKDKAVPPQKKRRAFLLRYFYSCVRLALRLRARL